MERDIQHVRTLVEDILSPVAMMGVPVEDHHAFAPGRYRGSCDSDVVEQAKSHRSCRRARGARRSYREKSDVTIAVAKAFDGVQTGTRSTQGGVKGSRSGDGVLVEMAASTEAMILDSLNVRRMVDDLELLSSCPAGFERGDHFCCRRVCDAGEDCLQALGTLRVPISCCVRGELLVTSEQHGHCHDRTAPGPLARRGCDHRFSVERPVSSLPPV